jgi:uncharacterized phiE125 gp8 family phage protein
MMLTEMATVAALALPIQGLKDHLRLGTGFADDEFQDALLESQLRAAIAAIEARIGKALLTRQFRLVLEDWRAAADQPFPLAPISQVVSITLFDGIGGSVLIDPARYRLVTDMHRPRLAATGTALPVVPSGGRIEVLFEAGFGAAWNAVPADLGHAVMLLSADFYEHRHQAGLGTAGLPFGVVSLIDRWRTVRVLGGSAS